MVASSIFPPIFSFQKSMSLKPNSSKMNRYSGSTRNGWKCLHNTRNNIPVPVICLQQDSTIQDEVQSMHSHPTALMLVSSMARSEYRCDTVVFYHIWPSTWQHKLLLHWDTLGTWNIYYYVYLCLHVTTQISNKKITPDLILTMFFYIIFLILDCTFHLSVPANQSHAVLSTSPESSCSWLSWGWGVLHPEVHRSKGFYCMMREKTNLG